MNIDIGRRALSVPAMSSKLRSSKKIFKSTLYQLYLLGIKERNPLLAKAFHLDYGKAKRLPIECPKHMGWRHSLFSWGTHQCWKVCSYLTQYHLPFSDGMYLITYLGHWNELGIQGECPYHFTQGELRSHSIDAKGWNEAQRIEGLMKRDGWTYPDTFDAAI